MDTSQADSILHLLHQILKKKIIEYWSLKCVVVSDLLEGDLARFPEVLLALLLLVRPELSDVRVVALGHVLGPEMSVRQLFNNKS